MKIHMPYDYDYAGCRDPFWNRGLFPNAIIDCDNYVNAEDELEDPIRLILDQIKEMVIDETEEFANDPCIW